MLKATLSLYHKMLPPSLGVDSPNPKIDWGRSPFYVNTELQPWEKNGGDLRRAVATLPQHRLALMRQVLRVTRPRSEG